jgi:hypothetical protein
MADATAEAAAEELLQVILHTIRGCEREVA